MAHISVSKRLHLITISFIYSLIYLAYTIQQPKPYLCEYNKKFKFNYSWNKLEESKRYTTTFGVRMFNQLHYAILLINGSAGQFVVHDICTKPNTVGGKIHPVCILRSCGDSQEICQRAGWRIAGQRSDYDIWARSKFPATKKVRISQCEVLAYIWNGKGSYDTRNTISYWLVYTAFSINKIY